MTPDNAVDETSSDHSPATTPIATIYQNSDQIAGILQQIFRQPLITDETRDTSADTGSDIGSDASASGDAAGKARIPFVGGAELGLHGQAGLKTSWTQNTGTASRQQFVYSQAYYLHLVREHLAEKGLLAKLATADGASALHPGAFVEYTTSFDPVELTLALDVISPELVDAVARYLVRRDYLSSFPEDGGHEARVQHAEKMEIESTAKGELARAITEAVKADTRQATTIEYYGRVASDPALTAITVCERTHFIIEDPDRLLDGTFTVLGKVIAPVATDVPTFGRNKLLRNLAPSALDAGIERLQELLGTAPEVGGTSPSDYVDLKLDSRVRGASLRVIPLAIFS
ncbi:DUF6414 family protein [Curtobacterium sp. USHLN213]|uniref:DUF6414 family protein n=1 Tax=Curtobacterium sp. USHLN213 TaxID=3081255 RepID=UPI00301728DF